MPQYAIVFFVIAIGAAILGFGGAGAAASFAQLLFFVFLILSLVSLVTKRRPI